MLRYSWQLYGISYRFSSFVRRMVLRGNCGCCNAMFRQACTHCSSDVVLFQGGYPAKLKKVLIVTAPLWFKAPFKILRLFVREKLRDRVFTVSIPQLTLHIPRESLPHRLGGTLEVQHETWLLHCLKSMTNRDGGELCEVSMYPAIAF